MHQSTFCSLSNVDTQYASSQLLETSINIYFIVVLIFQTPYLLMFVPLRSRCSFIADINNAFVSFMSVNVF